MSKARSTETFSETVSKNPRGRPRLLDATHLALAEFATDAKTLRHKQNVHYRACAFAVLMHDERFLWLCDPKAMQESRPHSFRPTILAELGRISNEDDLKAIALRICEVKPKTKEAVVMIRRWRLNRSGKGDALKLANEVIATINDYLARYPETTDEQVLTALFTASDMVSSSKKKKRRANR